MSVYASTQQPEAKAERINNRSTETTSKRFGIDSGGAIVFRSSDSVLFYIQQKHLEAYAEGFPLAKYTSSPTAPDEQGEKEVIPLTEKSIVLEILFQFMIPESPPDLDSLDFELLLELAEASEKYVVYGARKICALQMRDFVTTDTEKVFAFAAEHNHHSLLLAVAPLLVSKPLQDIAHLLPPDVLGPWSIYQTNFLRLMNGIADVCSIRSTYHNPEIWHAKVMAVRQEIVKDPSKLKFFRFLLRTSDPQAVCESHCCNSFKQWRDEICKEIEEFESVKTISLRYRRKKYGNRLAGGA